MPQSTSNTVGTVWRYVSAVPDRVVMSQADHRATLDRLAEVASFAVPAVVADFDGWMATTSVGGGRADQPDRHPDPDDLVVAVGNGLRELHQLDPEKVFGRDRGNGWSVVAARATLAVERGLVDPLTLPPPYNRYGADQLLAMMLDGRPDPGGDAAHHVVCHGRPTMDCFHVEGGRFNGLARFETAIAADRHLDLAVIHQSVQETLGPEAVFRFYEAYALDPVLPRLEHYILAGHLTGPLRAAEVIAVPEPS